MIANALAAQPGQAGTADQPVRDAMIKACTSRLNPRAGWAGDALRPALTFFGFRHVDATLVAVDEAIAGAAVAISEVEAALKDVGVAADVFARALPAARPAGGAGRPEKAGGWRVRSPRRCASAR